jgi:hypothetical protein
MSLKNFHVFFITVSILGAVAFGVWGIYYHITQGDIFYFFLGIASLFGGAGMVIYEIKILEKLKNM